MMKSSRVGAVTAGFLCLAVVHAGSSWGVVGFGTGQSLDVKEFLTEARASKAPEVPPTPQRIRSTDPAFGKPGQAVEWVLINGAKFLMGTDDSDIHFRDAHPYHEVTIKNFEMSKTLVTVEQYAECVIKGKCTEPGTDQWTGGALRSVPR